MMKRIRKDFANRLWAKVASRRKRSLERAASEMELREEMSTSPPMTPEPLPRLVGSGDGPSGL
jgi:hypothetical protein